MDTNTERPIHEHDLENSSVKNRDTNKPRRKDDSVLKCGLDEYWIDLVPDYEASVLDCAILEPSSAGYVDAVVTKTLAGRSFEDDDSANSVGNRGEDSDEEQIALDDERFYDDKDWEPANKLY
ncbi:hypothetical protein LTR50_007555 [Elasticomyces elasticus]|nr:hypothetical protein LTR50_007555 [Elasticomyces elasticus]